MYVCILFVYYSKRHSDSCKLLVGKELRVNLLVCVGCSGSLVCVGYGPVFAYFYKGDEERRPQVGGGGNPDRRGHFL